MKPKRIMFVASRIEHCQGARFYAHTFKVNNGLIRAGHNVYWFSDRDMARYLAPIPSKKLGVGKCNKVFIEYCRNIRPEVIILCHADIIRVKSLLKVKEFLPDVKIIQYNVDALYFEKNMASILSKADIVDATFSTTSGSVLKTLTGAQSFAAFLPNPVDSSIDRGEAHLSRDLPIDVFFAGTLGTWSDKTDLRSLAINQLQQRLPQYKIIVRTGIWGAEYIETLGQSKIGICFSHRPPDTYAGDGSTLYLYSSDRISQYMGNGMLTFVNKINDLDTLYGDDAIVSIENFEEFIEKIEYYLGNDDRRMAIAARGHQVAHEQFNSELIANYMLESLYDEPFSHPYHWPTERYWQNQ